MSPREPADAMDDQVGIVDGQRHGRRLDRRSGSMHGRSESLDLRPGAPPAAGVEPQKTLCRPHHQRAGGVVTLEMAPGQVAYAGTSSNGITSSSSGSESCSYTFP